MRKLDSAEAVLWSIALPGFPQLLTGDYVKGVLFILLEILFNVLSRFNEAIMLSFLGETIEAARIIDYQWLMFYPCLYMYSMWDAYKSTMKEDKKYMYLPFVFAAYTVTVGLMVSPKVEVAGLFIGPVFTPMLFLIPGLAIGFGLRAILLRQNGLP
ncbi:MAG TPA: hypothetical protein VEY51_17765 [Chondromyces sp.]|nr:hypothetical protein [Chondromyces sp.]